jgi:hypothetical protein
MRLLRLFFLLSGSLLMSLPALCQDTGRAPGITNYGLSGEEPYLNTIKVNVLPLPAGSLNVFYERVLNPEGSLNVGLSYYRYRGLLSGTGTRSTRVALTAEYRFYLTDEAPKGLYISPYLKLRQLTTPEYNYSLPSGTRRKVSGGFGGTLGFQHVARSGFVIGMFLGLGYFPRLKDQYYYNDDFGSQIDFRLGLNLGFAFGK